MSRSSERGGVRRSHAWARIRRPRDVPDTVHQNVRPARYWRAGHVLWPFDDAGLFPVTAAGRGVSWPVIVVTDPRYEREIYPDHENHRRAGSSARAGVGGRPGPGLVVGLGRGWWLARVGGPVGWSTRRQARRRGRARRQAVPAPRLRAGR
jgi:hypothetical protein